MTGQSIIQLDLSDRLQLYMAYMPFIRGGALFIPTRDNYAMGDEVVVLLKLPGAETAKGVAGKVVWISPRGASSPRRQGIGVQFSEQDRGETDREIQALMAGRLAAEKPTQTL